MLWKPYVTDMKLSINRSFANVIVKIKANYFFQDTVYLHNWKDVLHFVNRTNNDFIKDWVKNTGTGIIQLNSTSHPVYGG